MGGLSAGNATAAGATRAPPGSYGAPHAPRARRLDMSAHRGTPA
jgi:hypothetical protein